MLRRIIPLQTEGALDHCCVYHTQQYVQQRSTRHKVSQNACFVCSSCTKKENERNADRSTQYKHSDIHKS